jgi:hypothetical protein
MDRHAMKIDLIMPDKSHTSLKQYTEELHDALVKENVEARLISSERLKPAQFIDTITKQSPDFTLSFNGLLPDQQGRFLADMIGIPHVALLTEFPTPFSLLKDSPKTIIGSPDRYGAAFLQGIGALKSFYFPLGVKIHETDDTPKKYKLIYIGSHLLPETIIRNWKKNYPEPFVQALLKAGTLTLENESLSYVEAVTQAFDEKVKDGSLFMPRIDMIAVLIELEDYIQSLNAVNMLDAALKDKIDLHIFEEKDRPSELKTKYKGTSLVFHTPVSYSESLTIIAESENRLINSFLIKKGIPISVLTSLSLRCQPIINKNSELKEFPAYSPPYYQFDLETKTPREFLQEHTWEKRVKPLLKELLGHL